MSAHQPEQSDPTPSSRADLTQRGRRTRRAVVTFAAFGALAILPTACDLGYSLPPAAGGGAGTTAPSTVQTVPAASTGEYTEVGYGGSNGGAGGPSTDVEVPDPEVPAPGGEVPPAGGGEEEPPVETTTPGDETTTEAPVETTTEAPVETTTEAPVETTTEPPVETTAPPANNGLEVLGRDCTPSTLEPHTGFQQAPRCVSTSFGEVAAAAQSPSLLITDAPETVGVGEPFSLTVSTRNLVRDRFLGAAVGGYYLESSFLTAEGLQRGHFHTACRMLESTDFAPDASPVPAFFLATQDNQGGSEPDFVEIDVAAGMPTAGTAQCAVWAGDGSHRIPMMERANQTPAFDIIRITVG